MDTQYLSPNGENPVPVAEQSAMEASRFEQIIIMVSVTVLIGAEIWLTGAAALWAVHGLLGLPLWADFALGTMVAVPALWGSYHLVRLALPAEKQG